MLDHLKFCKGPIAMRNYSGRQSYSERVCNQKNRDNSRQSGNLRPNGNGEQKRRRVQLFDQEDEDKEEENTQPYYMARFFNGYKFKAMIVRWSPVTTFAVDDKKLIIKRKALQVREMIENQRYLDFDGKTIKPPGICSLRKKAVSTSCEEQNKVHCFERTAVNAAIEVCSF